MPRTKEKVTSTVERAPAPPLAPPRARPAARERRAAWSAVFVVLLGLSFAITGVGFLAGSSNHDLQVPLVRHLDDSGLYPADPFVATLAHYMSAVWPAVAVLARIVPLQALLALLLVLSRAFLMWAAGRLAGALAPGSRLAVLAGWTFIAAAPVPLVGDGTLVVGYFEHTSLSLALMLLALAEVVKGRPFPAAAWAGLGTLANLMYGIFGASFAAVTVLALPEQRQRWREWLHALPVFVAVASPIAVWIAFGSSGPPHDAAGWLTMLRAYYPAHFFVDTWTDDQVTLFALLFAATLAGGSLLARRDPRVYAACLAWHALCLAWLGVAWAAPHFRWASVVVLHPARSVDVWTCLAVLFVTARGAALLEAQDRDDTVASLVRGSAVLFAAGVIGTELRFLKLFPVALGLAAAIVALQRFGGPALRARARFGGALVVLSFVVVGGLAARSVAERGLRGALVRTPDADLAAVSAWAREHTARDAQFLVPPGWGAFRGLAERTPFVTWKEGAAMLWDPPFAAEWAHRVEALGIDVQAAARGPWSLLADLDRAYAGLDRAGALRIAAGSPVTYWVAPRERAGDAPAVFETARYRVIRIAAGSE